MRPATLCGLTVLAAFACVSKTTTTPAELPPPEITGLGPSFATVGDPYSMVIAGHFLAASQSSKDLPTAKLNRIRDLAGNPATAEGISIILQPDPRYDLSQRVQYLVGDFPSPAMTGVYTLTVRTTAGLETRFDDALVVFPRGELVDTDQKILCGSTGDTVTFHGTFEKFGDIVPGTRIALISPAGEVVSNRPLLLPAVTECSTVPFARADVEICSRLDLQLPQGWLERAGRLGLWVAMGPGSDAFRELLVERSAAQPGQFRGQAVDDDLTLSIQAGFLVTASKLPVVLLDGAPAQVRPENCSQSGIDGWQFCGIGFVVPRGTAPGDHSYSARSLSHCTASGSVHLVPKPQIASVSPASMCRFRLPPFLTIRGAGFEFADTYLDGKSFQSVGCATGTCLEFFALDGLSVGIHEIVVRNRAFPRDLDSNPAPVMVTPGPPIPGAITPSRIYSGATRPLFVPLSNVTGSVAAASLFPMSGPPNPLPVEFSEVAGGVIVTYPALGGDNEYLVQISDQSPCEGNTSLPVSAISDPVLAALGFDLRTFPVTAVTEDGSAPPTLGLVDGGLPAPSAGAARVGAGADWYFNYATRAGDDLGALSFDLQATGTGDRTTAPGMVLVGSGFRLERELVLPDGSGGWVHHEVSLVDPTGWTYHDVLGQRPANASELRRIDAIRILGSWWSGSGGASLDNFTLELVH